MLILSDRVKQTSITTGSGTLTLADTFGGFQSFSNAIGDGNVTYYTIENGVNFEVGIGTYISNTLSRDLVLDSSNNGQRIDLDGVSIVFCTYPADHSFFLNEQGYGSGQLPYYSGIAFPDGTVQSSAAIDASDGKQGAITYWDTDFSLSYIDEVNWDTVASGLSINGELLVDDDITLSGTLNARNTWFYRNSAGCFFHAYVDNTYDKMIALYSDNATNPTWKLGVKGYSTDFTTQPTQGWIEGKNGTVSINPDYTSNLKIDYTTGLSFIHQSSDIIVSTKDDGTVIYGLNAASVPLTVKAAPAQSQNIQEWTDYSDSVVASIDVSGQIDISSIKFPDNTVQSTAFRAEQVIYKTINSSTYLDSLDDVIFADCSSNNIDLNLPTASGIGGKKITIKRKSIGNYSLTILPSGLEQIDGTNMFSIPYANQSITLISDNSDWFVI
jgi:hypothetical protein